MYFYVGISKKGFGYFKCYIFLVVFLLLINVLEDFIKFLLLSFCLFGNIFVDELVVGVLIVLVLFVVLILIMLLGLFISVI